MFSDHGYKVAERRRWYRGLLTKVLRYGCFPGYDENGKKLRMLIDNARRGGRITEVQYQLLSGIRRVHYVGTCGLPTSNDGVEASEQDGGVEVASSSKEDGVKSSSKAASSFQPAARKRLRKVDPMRVSGMDEIKDRNERQVATKCSGDSTLKHRMKHIETQNEAHVKHIERHHGGGGAGGIMRYNDPSRSLKNGDLDMLEKEVEKRDEIVSAARAIAFARDRRLATRARSMAKQHGDRILVLEPHWVKKILALKKTLVIHRPRLKPGEYFLGSIGRIYVSAILDAPIAIEDVAYGLLYRKTYGLSLKKLKQFNKALPYRHPGGGAGGVMRYNDSSRA